MRSRSFGRSRPTGWTFRSRSRSPSVGRCKSHPEKPVSPSYPMNFPTRFKTRPDGSLHFIPCGLIACDTNVRDHWDSQGEHYQADSNGELDSVRTKLVRPVVNHAGYEGLHDAKFAVDTEYLRGSEAVRIKSSCTRVECYTKVIYI